MTKPQVDLLIQPCAPHHDRQGFTSGQAQLDDYLRKHAAQDIKRNINAVFVATKNREDRCIAGYYTLCSLSVETPQFPVAAIKSFPKRPVPCALLGRLAVALAFRNLGVGRMLLSNAIRRTQAASQQIGIHALVVDALDANAREFYQKFGFHAMGESSRLFLPMR